MKSNVPATVFLPTNFICTERRFWTDRLAQILHDIENHSNIPAREGKNLPDLVIKILTLSGSLQNQIDKAIKMLKPYPLNEVEDILEKLIQMTGNCLKEIPKQLLSWEEVKNMQGSGLISFESHTAEHQILATISQEEADHELVVSK